MFVVYTDVLRGRMQRDWVFVTNILAGAVAMKRFMLAVISAAALCTPALAADCAKDYKQFWNSIDRDAFARLSPEQMVDLNRTTLRVYDSCTSGDERFTAGDFYRQLDASHYAKASDIFNSGAFAAPGVRK